MVAYSLRIHTSDFLCTSNQKHRLSYESATGSTRGFWKVIQTLCSSSWSPKRDNGTWASQQNSFCKYAVILARTIALMNSFEQVYRHFEADETSAFAAAHQKGEQHPPAVLGGLWTISREKSFTASCKRIPR